MAKISTYPILSTPTVNDLLIGTDVENLNETKNFSIGDIGTLIGQDYVPYVGATGNVNLGSFNITGGGFIVGGGTASQFLKADGSLDSTLYTPQTRTLTINGTTYNLSANRSWDLNTIDSLTTTGTSGAATYVGKVLNIPVYQAQGSYITQLSGEATGSGPGNASVTLSNAAVISKVLTGLNVTGGTVVSTDTILQAFGKVQNQINGLTTGVTYQGVWNAATNVPFLQSSVGTKGYYYVVDVAGNTNLNGITDWQVGDWAIYNGSVWQKVDNTDAVVSVNGYVGAVVLTASDVGAVPTTRTLTINGVGYNLSSDRAWTVGDVRTDGSYANPSWITSLGWSKITGTPTTLAGYGITDGALNTTTLTINGVTYDLTANRSWSVGTVTSVGTSGPLTGGTITGSGTIGITQSSSTTDGYLSSADWNAFNSKQGAISVNAPLTFVSGVIGITQSGASSDGYLSSTDWNTFNSKVSGSGTANTLPMWGSASSLINSPLSYAADAFNFQYNSSTGGTVNFTNIGLTAYTYSIQMNNFGSPRSTIHSYTDGLIIQSIGGTQVSRMFANGNLILGTGTVDNGYKLEVTGNLYLNTIANAIVDTDRFIVSDGGVIKYRTGAQVLSDIGAQGALTLTTTGSSGPATLIGDTLNIPNYSSSLTGYVPYTGATQNVNLGEYGLTTGFLGFDLTPTGTPTTVGTMYWDSFYRTPSVVTGTGATTLQIGQEEVLLVHNNTGSALTDGQVVYVTGSTGELPSVSLADASSETTSAATLGVVTESIANGANGFVTVSGIVHGINTLAYTEGDILWLSETAGQFTNVKPVSPAHLVLIGYVIKRAGGNGSILVKIQNTQELSESSDVLISSPKLDGQGLFLQTISGVQLWRNRSIADVLGYTPANAATTLTINGTTFDLSANRTWSVGTVTSVAALTLGTSGTDLSSTVANGTTTPVITLNVPTASATNRGALSAADWSTFNAKQNALTLTTTGTSGAATLVGSTLNIPNYGSALSGYVPYTGATSNVDLGIYTLSSSNLIANGGFNSGALFLKQSNNAQTINLNYTTITPIGTTQLNFGFSQSSGVWKSFVLNAINLTNNTNRTYTLPDANGTIALVGGAGVGTVTSVGLSSATSGVTIGSTPVTSSGTITLAIATASGSQQGLLSAADWTTFNNKQNALTNPVTGTGTTNYLPKFTGTSTIGNSQIFDNGTSVGINTSTPNGVFVLDVVSRDTVYNTRLYQPSTLNTSYNSLLISGAMTSAIAYFGIGGSATGNTSFRDSVVIGSQSSHPLVFNTADAERMEIFTDGNVSISNSPSNAGFKLDVNGTGRFTSDLTANRYRGVNSLILNTYTTVNPSSNVYLYSPPNDRDAWIYLDSADTSSNWGIYHRQIDSAVAGLPGNSIGFIGGGTNTLQSYINILNGDAYFRGNVGIGTLSSANALGVLRASTSFQLMLGSDSTHQVLLGADSNYAEIQGIRQGIAFDKPLVLQRQGGNVLIGTTSDNGNRLRVNGITWVDGMIFSVQSNGTVRTSNADAAGMLHIRPNAGQNGYINFTENAVADRWSIGVTAGDGNFYFRTPYPTSPAVASISISGAATFSSSVTAQVNNISADGAGVVLQGYVDNTLRIAVRGSGYNSGARGGLLASTGDFSSSVTASNNVLINLGTPSTPSTGGTLWLTTNNNTTRAAAIQAVTLSNDNAHDLLFYTNPTFSTPVERMRITSGGYLVLGGASSVYGQAGRGTFEMNGSADNILAFRVAGSLAGYFYTNASFMELYSTNILSFATGGAERFRISSTGFVSAGPITNGRLGVRGFTNDSSGYAFEAANASGNSILLVRNDGAVGINTVPQKPFEALSAINDFVSVGVNALSVGQWSGIQFGYREANTFYRKSAIVFERTDLTSGNAQGKIHILNGPQSGIGSATLADARLTIAENGNVLIGTTTDNGLGILQVNGNIILAGGSSSGQTQLSSGFTTLRFPNQFSSGFTDAGVKLFIFNSGSTIQGFTAGPQFDLQYHSSGSSAGRHAFYVGNQEIIRFNQTNVLIGTTTDVGATLHVNGTIRTGQLPGAIQNAVNWRLGTARGGPVTSNATVRVEIDGVLVDLLARYV